MFFSFRGLCRGKWPFALTKSWSLTKGDSNGYHLSFAANVRKIMVYSNIYSGFLQLDFGELLFFTFHFSLFT
ncbi:hypothetical protein HMPREF1551_02662 [Capnocytophaga sp. oral taxon 863 str. F0517]|nr:hypothetical protein HMPREF1551_02662 [Capnocytophaga sp. oral taxon 863 str. F0517]